LSEHYKSVEHTFSGSPEQKSAATVVQFESPSQINFLPKEILNDFPRLNGIMIWSCKTFATIRDNLFSEEFGTIQYLFLRNNKIATIAANAFQHLPKLKWISLSYNQLRSLPHQIFKNNPEMKVIWLHGNNINSITPDFFKNLNKLKYVDFEANECANKEFGCESGCSVSQSQLVSGFATCFNNCLQDVECAAVTGNLDNLSSEQIEKNLDLIVASGHKQMLIEKGYGQLIAEKNSTPKPELVPEETKNFKNDTLECEAKKFEEISQDLKKELAENSKVQQETIETLGNNLTLLIQAHDSELKSLKQELADLKMKLEESNENLKIELGELFKKEFKEFVSQVNGTAGI
jgi:Leucine-rich repeat (LRR) protein